MASPLAGPTAPERVKPPPPKPSPVAPPMPELAASPTGDAKRAATIDGYFSAHGGDFGPYVPLGRELLEVAKATPLDPALAAASINKETWARNIFGCDYGSKYTHVPPFCQVPVTKARVQALIKNFNAPPPGVGENGVGVTQITSMPFVLAAERLGGAHIVRNQMVVGFGNLRDRINALGYEDGLAAYNAGEGNLLAGRQYALDLMELHEEWKARIGQAVPNSGLIVPRPSDLHTPGSGPYVRDHPTHYNWVRPVYDMIVRYLNHPKLKGKIWINTYRDHPPGWGLDSVSWDVWAWKGRGHPLSPELRKLAFDIIFNDPQGPRIWWIISGGGMWTDTGGWEDAPAGPPDSDALHNKHIHITNRVRGVTPMLV